ncbi:MAG: ribose-5-phosphate isomerase RpiA [Gemmataceae bacterium]|nr:ribose-5-phosphate isomerase RpiA [Gemmataceae bacterium]
MTIYEKALEYIQPDDVVGLGSGRASVAFIKMLGERVKSGLKISGVPTSESSAALAVQLGIPLVSLENHVGKIRCAVDGADEVDPQLNLIKGYGRALVREKIIAASANFLIVLVGQEKQVPKLGSRGKLPVEVVPFSAPLVKDRLEKLNIPANLWTQEGKPGITDNGNWILDCQIKPQEDPSRLEEAILAIPGVVDTGFFLGMAGVVLTGNDDFKLVSESYPK